MFSAEPVCSCAFFACAFCTRDRGCSAHPVFPAPSDFGERDIDSKTSRETCGENAEACRWNALSGICIRDNSSGGSRGSTGDALHRPGARGAAALLTMRVQDLILGKRV